MGTIVSIDVAGPGDCPADDRVVRAALDRAFGWFDEVEARCTRFDPQSELMQLTAHAGDARPASAILFEAVAFALALAAETGGAFDPTLGLEMEARGFNREYRTGRAQRTAVIAPAGVSYRDVAIDRDRRTIALTRPLVLDLGAVAKGLAVDLAARELASLENFVIDAGGDLYLGGRRAAGGPWRVGIRHPRGGGPVAAIRVSNAAVCTSGDYERRASGGRDGHHILDPRTGASAAALASATVVAPSAMAADGLATAAFVLGPADGLALLRRHGADGFLMTPELEWVATPLMRGRYDFHETRDATTAPGDSAILPHA